MATKAEMVLAVKAVQQGFTTQERVQECMDRQMALAEEGSKVNLVQILYNQKYLTRRQIIFLQSGDGVAFNLDKERDRCAIEGYTLLEKIGRGGMATVFLAERHSDGEQFAIKVLFPHHAENEAFVAGFENEGAMLCGLSHENLVRGVEVGRSGIFHYMALEYVKGESVQSMINSHGALPEELALAIILQVARVLDYLGSQDITHRDIKPDNMLINRDGQIKLCDLGFAKVITPEAAGIEDQTCGTVQYISPEQARGRTDVDIRSDIYSLGATLYHLIVGEVPFSGEDRMEIMAKQVREGLSSPKLKNRRQDVARHTHYFIEKMMAKDREVRYQSPAEVIEDIEATVEGNRSLQFNPYGSEREDPFATFFESRDSDRENPGAGFAEGNEDSASSRRSRVSDRSRLSGASGRRRQRGETRQISRGNRKERLSGRRRASGDREDSSPDDSIRRKSGISGARRSGRLRPAAEENSEEATEGRSESRKRISRERGRRPGRRSSRRRTSWFRRNEDDEDKKK
ncbi:MAG: serine/threonine-protein kinase [Planctomycetota bacterium]|nr:serine/threonine-protein kinase [Planctomycetota bacterium]